MDLTRDLDMPTDDLQRLGQSLPHKERTQDRMAIDDLLPSPLPGLYIEVSLDRPAKLATVDSHFCSIETLEQEPGLHRGKRIDVLDLLTWSAHLCLRDLLDQLIEL